MTTQETASALIDGLSSVIRGKRERLELFTAAYLSGGHVLLEDVPGIGKTTLAKALARLVGMRISKARKALTPVSFRRIQFTPDLLPYDITGVDVFNPKDRRFDFVPGPIFSDILLADEINRTTPKVQSALLEVMAERQVSVGGTTRSVSDVFFVVATQNPVETEGTYPLPAAQLDRFMLRLSLGYPEPADEIDILRDDPSNALLPKLLPVVSVDDVRASRLEQEGVFCHPSLERAIVEIAGATRSHPSLKLGLSPRGSLQLLHAARCLALVRGRGWVSDTDILDLSGPVIAHRLVARERSLSIDELVLRIASDTLRSVDRKAESLEDASRDASR